MSSSRFARVSASSAPIVPSSRAASAPPARSMPVKTSHAAAASCSVSDSTYQEPPAASVTRARLDSSDRIDWVLRAMRRAKSSDRPIAASNGVTVIASAPPTAAAKQPIVARSMFTHGSRRVSSAGEVTACWACPGRSSGAPDSSATRSQTRRAARSFAMDGNCSAVTAQRNSTAASASDSGRPPSTSARR